MPRVRRISLCAISWRDTELGLPVPHASVEITFEGTKGIAGTVRTKKGRGVEGALVVFLPAGGNLKAMVSARTDRRGAFRHSLHRRLHQRQRR